MQCKHLLAICRILSIVIVSGLSAQTLLYQQDFESMNTPEEAGWGIWWGEDKIDLTLEEDQVEGLPTTVLRTMTNPSSRNYSVVFPTTYQPLEVSNPKVSLWVRNTTSVGFYFMIRVQLENGDRRDVFYYPESRPNAMEGESVNCYMGSHFMDGQWHLTECYLQTDLAEFTELAVISVQYIVLYGDAHWDNIEIVGTDQRSPLTNQFFRITNVLYNSATFYWHTSHFAQSEIHWGIGNPSESMLNNKYEIIQIFTLTGLTENTEYIYQLVSRDLWGRTLESDIATFKTPFKPEEDQTPPVISNIQLNPSITSAQIDWDTDELCEGRIEYAVMNGHPVIIGDDYEVVENPAVYLNHHVAHLENLLPNMPYCFRIVSTDQSGNISESTGAFQTHTDPSGDLYSPAMVGIMWRILPRRLDKTTAEMDVYPLWDAQGVEYFFECLDDYLLSSGWMESNYFKLENLDAEKSYAFHVRARDKSVNHNRTVGTIEVLPPWSSNPSSDSLWIQNDKGIHTLSRVGIGTDSPDNALDVNGTVRAKEVIVETGWADYVFDNNYSLRSLEEVETFIRCHKHLPDIPPASQIQSNGVRVGEMQSLQMQKTEELMLYILEQDSLIHLMKERLSALEESPHHRRQECDDER